MTISNFSNQKKERGFTFVELIITIFVISIGILGAFSVLQQIISSSSMNSPKLVGSYLAQEGIEIVRNIRDTNWLEGEDWRNGLDICSSSNTGCDAVDGCAGDYQSSFLENYSSDDFLYINSDGFYHQETTGEITPFKRRIVINENTDAYGKNYLEVKVYVCWEQKGQKDSIEAQEYLYNWR